MTKFKAGEEVRIRGDLKNGRLYGGAWFGPGMKKWKGKVVRVIKVLDLAGLYKLDAENWEWSDAMLDRVK